MSANRAGVREALVTSHKPNWAALVVLVAFHQVLGMAWYSGFGGPWMEGIGRTKEELVAAGSAPYLISLVASAMTVYFLSLLLAMAGARTAASGARWGALLWLFVLLPFAALHYSFALIPWTVTAIDAGIALAGVTVSGAVLGGWQPKRAAVAHTAAA